MTPTDEELRAIADLCEGPVTFRVEGERRLIHMSGLRFLANGMEQKTDALLCLNHNNPTYPTKLYFPTQIPSIGLNWNETAYILGRSWATFSWRDVSNDRPPIEILAAHLAPLNRGQAA